MAKVIPIGAPANDAERLAIAHLRDSLPDSYLLVHNFEIVREGEAFEVDVAVLAPHAVYLVDVKGTRGMIEAFGSKWHPEGRQPYMSPLLKLRGHARTLKGIITSSHPGRRELEDLYVDAAVLLTAPDAHLVDPGGRDATATTTLGRSAIFFQSAARIPPKFSSKISALHSLVLKAIQAKARPVSGPPRFGNWVTTERLGGTDAYTEYRATNLFVGPRSGTVLLRVYQADPYLPEDAREAQKARIANAYKALNRLPAHPAIVGARDFFATETADRYILVTDDAPGRSLQLHIAKATFALTLDQKRALAADILSALAHACAHGVIHRNLTPGAILVADGGRARLTGFEFARSGADRSRTIAAEIIDELDPAYQAPECQRDPGAATAASDVYSAGLLIYELFSGERPFSSPTEVFDRSGVFPLRLSETRSDLPDGFDDWLQCLCAFEASKRPTAEAALTAFEALFVSVSAGEAERRPIGAGSGKASEAQREPPLTDYADLSPGTALTEKYVVEKRLGRPGGFGVVYKVIDTLGDVARAVKLVLRDRHSTLDRLKKEYRALLRVPDHPNVVRVVDASLLPGQEIPFIVFEYVEGLDVGEMMDGGLFTATDGLELGRQVADGLIHLHRHGVYHCDIKPSNLLWTDRGVRIIDFNVAVTASLDDGPGGGSRRYLPPDLDTSQTRAEDLADRDVYALGVTLYETVTGRYPWDGASPPPGEKPRDPREISGLGNLAPELADIMIKAIAPRRADRFVSAEALRAALVHVRQARRTTPAPATSEVGWRPRPGEPIPPNTNPFVSHLLTLYSQSHLTNAGTRGLDPAGEETYVETALDRELAPAILAGEFQLVVITGNAGDGKTAFLQRLATAARNEGAPFDTRPNGSRFTLRGRTFVVNHDGSQDEGDETNDRVLARFFSPFVAGGAGWKAAETRLIAINEGRLVDFLQSDSTKYATLRDLVERGLAGGPPEGGAAVVNLNLRSVVTDAEGGDGSIIERLVRRMTHERFWDACGACDLRDRCYALHNARTFQDPLAGPKVLERLKTLYALTHLRGRLHVTLRDLRSALAFMLTGARDCEAIHKLYSAGKRAEVLDGFYFNSWMGGESRTADRLLSVLKELDMGWATDPREDRRLDFLPPEDERSLLRFEGRSGYVGEVLQSLFEALPRDAIATTRAERASAHRMYVAMSRRRRFFERRDGGSLAMLPYRTGARLLDLVGRPDAPALALPEILAAMNRAEGLPDGAALGGDFALQVRDVEGGTIRSYRVFASNRFTLSVKDDAVSTRFLEHMPNALVLRYVGDGGARAALEIDLDTFEMLGRLTEGYRPTVEEAQGYYVKLAVFKNLLAAAPYQEVLLTTTGYDFYRVRRDNGGRLALSLVAQESR